MEKIKDLKDIIEQEDLNPNYFKREARAIVMEFDREYTDPNYVIEKVRHLVDIAFLVCRAEHGRDSPKVDECVKKLLRLKDWIKIRWVYNFDIYWYIYLLYMFLYFPKIGNEEKLIS